MHCLSPTAFIRNPLLWIEILARQHVNWGVAPDFAVRLVARKFVEQRSNGNPHPIRDLDLASLYRIQVCAEPVQLDTKQIFEEAFGEYGLRKNWFLVGYGLAEHVVGVSWALGLHRPIVRGTKIKDRVVAVGSRDTLDSSSESRCRGEQLQYCQSLCRQQMRKVAVGYRRSGRVVQ